MATIGVVERPAQTEAVSQTVVSAVAELIGSQPESLDPLYHAVDPDALDALFGRDRRGGERAPIRVSFTYCDCDVALSGDGTVRVSNAERTISKTWR